MAYREGRDAMDVFIGFDTGINHPAIAIISDDIKLLYHDCLQQKDRKPLDERERAFDKWVFCKLNHALCLIRGLNVLAIGIEDSYFAKNQKTVKRMSESIGAIRAACHYMLSDCGDFPIYHIAPTTAKKAVSGSGTATKYGVEQAVCRYFGIEEGTLVEHECDAAAIAIAARNEYFKNFKV